MNHLIVAKLDRLGRNVRDALGVLKFCNQNGIILHVTDFGGDAMSTQGHMGEFMITVLLAVAEWELAEIQDRTQKRMDAKFNAGEITGNVPYGFDRIYTFADNHQHISAVALSPKALLGVINEHGTVVTKLLQPNLAEQSVIWTMKTLRDVKRPTVSFGTMIPTSYTEIATEMNLRG